MIDWMLDQLKTCRSFEEFLGKLYDAPMDIKALAGSIADIQKEAIVDGYDLPPRSSLEKSKTRR